MNINLEARPFAEVETEALVVVGFEGGTPPAIAADQSKELFESGEFTGKALEVSVLHRPAGLKAKRLVVAGGGKREKFASSAMRKLSGAVLRSLKSKGIHGITVALSDGFNSDEFAAAAVEGAI